MDKMRETFESRWGYTNEEQNCYFIPELDMYGSEFVNKAAEYKSTAWKYFQVGWKACQGSLVIDLDAAAKALAESMNYPWEFMPEQGRVHMKANARMVIEAAGLKVNP